MSKLDKKATVRAILADGVAIANAMQIPALQLPSFFDGAIKTEQELETTVQRLQEVCDLAEAHGIVVCTENALTVEDCLKLIALVDRQNLKVFFDTQNPWAMERQNAREILEGEYPYLYGAVHAKDGHGDKLSSAILGEGDSGFAQAMAVFTESDYAGWFILENNYHSIADAADWQANVRKDIACIENLLAV
jgi:sugar phosphate isomerase/epimerase